MLIRTSVSLYLVLSLNFSVEAFWTGSKNDESSSEGTDTKSVDEPLEYGVDVSFPIHYNGVSKNYPWLEHNLDPTVETPKEYKDMVIQPLGDRQSFYNNYLQGCIDKF